jgi:hypothetical protein
MIGGATAVGIWLVLHVETRKKREDQVIVVTEMRYHGNVRLIFRNVSNVFELIDDSICHCCRSLPS